MARQRLETEPSDHASAAYREHAMTLLSQATSASPIATLEAITLFQKSCLPSAVLNQLIGCDAARVSGSVIDVQHEALGDYIRAKALALMPDDEVLSLLPSLSMTANSFFPVLLMAQLRTRRLQSALWKRLSEIDLGVYLDALRYRFNISGELEQLDPDKLSEEYLHELIDGIEAPLNGFFPELREAVLEHLTGDGTTILAATGRVSSYPGALSYKLHALEPCGARVTVAMPTFPGTLRHINLDLSRYRIDRARLLGMTLLRDAVLMTVKHLQDEGWCGIGRRTAHRTHALSNQGIQRPNRPHRKPRYARYVSQTVRRRMGDRGRVLRTRKVLNTVASPGHRDVAPGRKERA